jgi:hypothetical protein
MTRREMHGHWRKRIVLRRQFDIATQETGSCFILKEVVSGYVSFILDIHPPFLLTFFVATIIEPTLFFVPFQRFRLVLYRLPAHTLCILHIEIIEASSTLPWVATMLIDLPQ